MDCPLDPGYESYKTLVEGNTMDDIIMPYGREGSVGGIYRSVVLRGRGDSGIDELWATTELSQDLKRADVTVKLNLKSATPGGKAEIRATLTEPEHTGVYGAQFYGEQTGETGFRTDRRGIAASASIIHCCGIPGSKAHPTCTS